MDKAESTVPNVIKYNPKTTYANTMNRMNSWGVYTLDKVNVVRSFNLTKTVNGGLKSIDNLVDDYLPGAEDELTEEKDNDVLEDNVTGQLVSLVNKLRKRTFKRFQNVQRLLH